MALGTGSAHADFLYDFDSVTNIASDFKFRVPALLSAPTTIPAADLFDVITYPAGKTRDRVEFTNPFGISLITNTTSLEYPGDRVWSIGQAGRWYVPSEPGRVSELDPDFGLLVNGLAAQRGSSGALLVSDRGVIAIVVRDAQVIAAWTSSWWSPPPSVRCTCW